MPYLPGKFLRILSIIMVVGSLLGGVGYLQYVRSSGEVVATADPTKVNLPTVGVAENGTLVGVLTRQQTLTFEPINLTPAMGEIRLEIKVTQVGIINGGDQRFGDETYTLTNTLDQKPVFEKKTKSIIWSPDKVKNATSTASIKMKRVSVGKVTVPQDAPYVLTAALEQWILASPNISFTLEARTGTIEADVRYVVGSGVALCLGLFLMYLTTSPEQRKQMKVKRNGR